MRLVLTSVSGGATTEHALESGSLSLGRDEGCDVRFDAALPQVSRRHARIDATPEGFRLTDLGSTNGTLINREPVTDRLLRSGDVVQFGPDGPRLAVRIEGGRPAAPRPATRLAPTPAPSTLADQALYDPTRDKGRRYASGPIGLIAGMLALGGVLGLLVLMGVTFELGLGPALLGTSVAFFPAPFYLALWLWLDRYDPEPAWILAGCLFWGAGAATFLAGIVNDVFGATVFSLTHSKSLAQLLAGSVSAPLAEEAAKGLAVLLIYLVLRQEFDGVLDGIVYAGVVALGFAAVENVLYYGRVVAKEGAPGLAIVFFLRGVLGPFSHAVFTSMTGIGCGLARVSHQPLVRLLAPVGGYLGAAALHSAWNTMASLAGAGFLLLYVLVWVPLFIAFMAAVVAMGTRESRLVQRMLAREVDVGLLTTDDLARLGSWPRRIGWLLAAVGDARRLSARRRFLYAASRLALSYWHVERAAQAGGVTMSLGQIPLFRRELERLAPQV